MTIVVEVCFKQDLRPKYVRIVYVCRKVKNICCGACTEKYPKCQDAKDAKIAKMLLFFMGSLDLLMWFLLPCSLLDRL